MNNKPIILDNAVERVSDTQNKIFFYNNLTDMNVVKINNQLAPFIEIDNIINELITKTRVERERDDEDISLLELYTKTEVKREQDDDPLTLVELETKTFKKRERDDEDISLLELYTKTEVSRE